MDFRTIPELSKVPFDQQTKIMILDEIESLGIFGCGDFLSYVAPDFRDDDEIAMAAIEMDAGEYPWISDRLKNDREFAKEALIRAPYSFKYMSEEFHDDEELALLAVLRCGRNLKYASPRLRGNRDVVLRAIRHDYTAFYFIDESLFNDKEIALLVIRQDATYIKKLSKDLRNDKDIFKDSILEHPEIIQYMGPKLRKAFIAWWKEK